MQCDIAEGYMKMEDNGSDDVSKQGVSYLFEWDAGAGGSVVLNVAES